MHDRTIGALFTSAALGEAVREALLAARFTSANVTRLGDRDAHGAGSADLLGRVATTDRDLRRSFAGLARTGLDVGYFEARIARGDALVTVAVCDRVDDATEILLRAGADLGAIGSDAAMGTLSPTPPLGASDGRTTLRA